MGYFPFFMELSGQEGLIVGGGTVAARKAEKLLPYGPRLTVAALELLPELAAIPGLTLLRRPFGPDLLEGKLFVIAATDDPALNRCVAAACRQRRIPVNAVDDREACTFLFPALVKRGDLSVGISTGGASPSAAVYLKEQIAALLPGDFGDLLAELDALRPIVKEAIPEGARAAAFSRLFAARLAAGRPLEEKELRDILSGTEEEMP